MKTSEARNQRSRAFTLIELLVVTAIIAILASIAFPVYVSVQDRARRLEAKNTMAMVRIALASYSHEYHDWPPALLVGVPVTDDARIDADQADKPPSPGKWFHVFNTLLATGDDEFLRVNNKRRLNFMELAVKMMDNKVNPSLATTFLDPWGREYNIAIDTNGDNKIENLPNKETGARDWMVLARVVMWSYGPNPADVRKYVVSWE